MTRARPTATPALGLALAVALAVSGPMPSVAQTPAPPPAGGAEQPGTPGVPASVIGAAMFVQRMREANEFAVESSRLAMERATTGAVKEFAQTMIVDHTRASEALTAIVDDPKWKLPETPVKPSDRNAELGATLEKLTATTDPSFDRIYVGAHRSLHEELVTLVKDYAARGGDAELKTFAAAILPDLERHLEAIKRVPLPA